MSEEEFNLEGLNLGIEEEAPKKQVRKSPKSEKTKSESASKTASKELDFEKSLQRLEAIVAEMEQGKLSLDVSLKKFEEGTKLANYCSEKLNQSEKKIEILLEEKGKKTWTTYNKSDSSQS